jgi:hypothetical protein
MKDWIDKYLAGGWPILPVQPDTKRPYHEGWNDPARAFTAAEFAPTDLIGLRLGLPFVDFDLEGAAAIFAGRVFLLGRTGAVFGRPGAEASHYLFRVDGDHGVRREDVRLPGDHAGLELRGTGHQTVVPPSPHARGPRRWAVEDPPGLVTKEELFALWRKTATAAILMALAPPRGSGAHDFCKDAAGLIAHLGVDEADAARILAAVSAFRGLNDVDAAAVVRDTYDEHAAGRPVTGGPSLRKRVVDDFAPLIDKIYDIWQPEGAERARVLDEMNARHFVARIGKDTVFGLEEDGRVFFQKKDAFRDYYEHTRVVVGKSKKGEDVVRTHAEFFIDSPRRRQYREVVFAPPPAHHDERDYNLWKGFAVEPDPRPRPEERCAKYLDHVKQVVCSGVTAHYEYLLDLMAAGVQRPGAPSEVAVVLRGARGAGKGAFVRPYGSLFGRHFAHVSDPAHVTGKFNAHLSGKVVVFADEAIWAGNHRDLAVLKRLITEETITIERKGIDAAEERNHIHLFMATNDDWSVGAGMKERRFFALEVADARAQDHAYFGEIEREMADGGRAALLAVLQARDLKGRNLRLVPQTAELRRQQENTFEGPDAWWFEKLARGEFYARRIAKDDPWPAEVDKQAFASDYAEFAGVDRRRTRSVETMLGTYMRRVLPGEVIDGRRPNNGARVWRLPSLEKCRERWCALVGWPEDHRWDS